MKLFTRTLAALLLLASISFSCNYDQDVDKDEISPLGMTQVDSNVA